MIQRDEHGEPWLLCDLCVGRFGVEPRYHDPEINSFYGAGLTTAAQVRGVARGLQGWRRQKLITRFDPLESAWFDLCRACRQPEILAMRLVGVSARG